MDMVSGSRSIPTPLRIERESRSTSMETDISARDTDKVSNYRTVSGSFTQVEEYKGVRSGGSASLHKLLDPLWVPDSTTSIDVTSAVRYILQVKDITKNKN